MKIEKVLSIDHSKVETVDQLVDIFKKIHNTGIRFYTEKDLNDLSLGINLDEPMPGFYAGYTLKGVMQLAEQGYMKWEGKKINRDKAELAINAFFFFLKAEYDWKKLKE